MRFFRGGPHLDEVSAVEDEFSHVAEIVRGYVTFSDEIGVCQHPEAFRVKAVVFHISVGNEWGRVFYG